MHYAKPLVDSITSNRISCITNSVLFGRKRSCIFSQVWSNTIANVALNWAKTCTVGHNGKTGYGENLYFHTIRDKSQERDLIERGIKAWYDEYTLWNWSTGFTTPTGHYTQVDIMFKIMLFSEI